MNVLLTLIETIIDYSIEMFFGVLFGAILFFSTVQKRKMYLKNKNLVSGKVREITLLAFFIYSGCLIMLLLLPPNFLDILFIEGQISFTDALNYEFNFIPTIFLYFTGAYKSGIWVYAMFIGNIVMFIPFGVCIRLLWKTVSVKKFLAIDFFVIVIIETIQPFIGRSFDSNDIILNIFGGLLGFGMTSLLNKCTPQFVSAFRYQQY